MQPKQSESIDVDDFVPAGASDTNKRVAEFRNRKASAGHERLEIYTTQLVKEQVREFAKAKRLTRGVAAEVLLRRGIAAQISETQSPSVCDSGGLNGPTLPVATDAAQSIADDSIPEMARLFGERAKPNGPQRLSVTPLASDSLSAPQTQTAPKPADSKSSPEVIEPKVNSMAQWIREGSPQRDAEPKQARLKTEIKR